MFMAVIKVDDDVKVMLDQHRTKHNQTNYSEAIKHIYNMGIKNRSEVQEPLIKSVVSTTKDSVTMSNQVTEDAVKHLQCALDIGEEILAEMAKHEKNKPLNALAVVPERKKILGLF